jgi:hypothetical protein
MESVGGVSLGGCFPHVKLGQHFRHGGVDVGRLKCLGDICPARRLQPKSTLRDKSFV